MSSYNFGNMLEKVFDTDSALYQCLLYYIMFRKGVYYNKETCEYRNSYDDYSDELNTLYSGNKELFNFDIDIRGNESIIYNDFIKYDCTIGQVNFIEWLYKTGVLEHVYEIRVELLEELVEEGLLRGTPKILYDLNNKINISINKLKMSECDNSSCNNSECQEENIEDVILLDDMEEIDITLSTTSSDSNSNSNSNTNSNNSDSVEDNGSAWCDEDFNDEEKDKLIDSLELEDTVDMHIGAAYDNIVNCNCEEGDEGDEGNECDEGDEGEYVDGEEEEINYEFNKMMNEKMCAGEMSMDDNDPNFNESEFMSVLNETLQKIQEKYGAEQPFSEDNKEPNPEKMADIMKIFMDILMSKNLQDVGQSTPSDIPIYDTVEPTNEQLTHSTDSIDSIDGDSIDSANSKEFESVD